MSTIVNTELLKQAEEKIRFAEFLLRSTHTSSYGSAAGTHVLNASKLAIRALTDVKLDSPRAMQLALLKFEESEPKRFAKNFLNVSKQASQSASSIPFASKTNPASEPAPGDSSYRATKLALQDVKEFVTWIRQEQLNK